MPLAYIAARTVKLTQTTWKLSDDGGLQLWIMSSGSKLGCLADRDLSGRQRKARIDQGADQASLIWQCRQRPPGFTVFAPIRARAPRESPRPDPARQGR